MKTILQTVVALSIMLFSIRANAQNANDYLNDVYDYGQDAESHSKIAENILNSFATSYFVLGNTNTDVNAFVSNMQTQMSIVESSSDEIIYYANQAANANPGLDVSGLISKASQIEGLEDYIQNSVQALKNAIDANNPTEGQLQVIITRSYLIQQQSLALQVLNEAANLEAYFNLRIELIDNYGNVYALSQTGLGGFAIYNHETGQYMYPDYYTPDELYNLNPGTYTVHAYNGAFDGASSKTVTLSNNQVDANGYVVVQLNYWSE